MIFFFIEYDDSQCEISYYESRYAETDFLLRYEIVFHYKLKAFEANALDLLTKK